MFNTWALVSISDPSWFGYQDVLTLSDKLQDYFWRRYNGARPPLEFMFKAYLKMMQYVLDQVNTHGKSPRTMQSYCSFSVGGTLAVNAHGITTDYCFAESVLEFRLGMGVVTIMMMSPRMVVTLTRRRIARTLATSFTLIVTKHRRIFCAMRFTKTADG